MDDLVVIIITLLFVGIGAFGQMNKKKKLLTGPDKANPQKDFWNLVDQNLFFENQKVKKQPSTRVFTKERGPAVNEQGYSFKASDEGGSIIEKETKNKKVLKRNAVKENFSLKQAVIYNEILNRKYF